MDFHNFLFEVPQKEKEKKEHKSCDHGPGHNARRAAFRRQFEQADTITITGKRGSFPN